MGRNIILAFTIVSAVTTFGQAAQTPSPRQPAVAVEAPLTPEVLWNALVKGNKNFAAGNLRFETLDKERITLKDHQAPPITVLSCSDSRVPPELVFNQSLGTIFSIRTAGNIADEYGIASIEFAILSGYTKLIVILGHESCGAVKAALAGTDPPTPALNALVEQIRSSFVDIPYDSRDTANFRRAIEMNTRASKAQMMANSAIVRRAVQTEQVKIITAYYDFASGEVKPVP